MSRRPRTDLVWPVCTEPGCRHGRAWDSPAELQQAATDLDYWVDRNGRARCSCHGGVRSFPCDEGAVEP